MIIAEDKYHINNEWKIGFNNYFYLQNNRWSRKHRFPIRPLSFLILSLFNIGTNKKDIHDILCEIIRLNNIQCEQEINVVLSVFKNILNPGGNILFKHINAVKIIKTFLDNIYNYKEPLRSEAPVSVLFVVTNYCDHMCIYCYKNAKMKVASKSPKDSIVSKNRLMQTIDELKNIGVKKIIFTGGEPFLRKDIFEIFKYIGKTDIDLEVITKYHLSREQLLLLKKIKVKTLDISLDTIDDDIYNILQPGEKYNLHSVLEMISFACNIGIKINIRSVLSNLNTINFNKYVDKIYETGVRKIILDKYSPGIEGRNPAILNELSKRDIDMIMLNICDLQNKYPDLSISWRKDPLSIKEVPLLSCAGGIRGLTILPDGSVTKCEHWSRDNTQIFGNIVNQNIMDIWFSRRLIDAVYPQREEMRDTICYNCHLFDKCIERGRCIVSTYRLLGAVNGPDKNCLKGEQYGICSR